MKYLFGLVYILVLVTQLPHVWSAYAHLEAPGLTLAQYTSIGAAIAFEASTGVFTFRIVRGSRRTWTRRGLWFFIIASIVANGFYYRWFPLVFDTIWPAFATIALPLALALFAEEFGAEVKQAERAEKRQQRTTSEPKAEVSQPAAAFICSHPGCEFVATHQNGLNAHQRAHSNGHEREKVHA